MSLLFQKKKIFMKNYSKEDNVKLIKLVEEHECLWNCKHWEYFNKSYVENAWKNIAEMVNDTPRKTQQRWRTIRNMFGKNIHPTLKNKTTKYYLEPYLDFLRPFIRSCCRSKTCCQLPGKAKHAKDAQNDSTKYHAEVVEISSEDSAEITNEAKHTREAGSDYKVKKDQPKMKDTQEPKTKTSNELNSNMLFLDSLLPFVDDMTSYQNRRFRLKVLNMIDEILD